MRLSLTIAYMLHANCIYTNCIQFTQYIQYLGFCTVNTYTYTSYLPSICPFIYLFINFLAAFLSQSCCGNRVSRISQVTFYPASFFRHLHHVLPCQLGDAVPAACPGYKDFGLLHPIKFGFWGFQLLLVTTDRWESNWRWAAKKPTLSFNSVFSTMVRYDVCILSSLISQSVLPTFINNETLKYLKSSTYDHCFPLTWMG